MARVAEALGKPLMPWQKLVADIVFEVDDADKFAYKTLVLLTPRQAGKTTLELASMLMRALSEPGANIVTGRRPGWRAATR